MRISDWSSDVCSSDLCHAATVSDAASAEHRNPIANGIDHLGDQRYRPDRRIVPAAIVALRDDHVDPRLYNLQCMFDFAHHCHDDRAVGVKAVHPRSGIAQSRRIDGRSEEHTSELQSLMRISYAVFCLKKKKSKHKNRLITTYSR